MLKKLLSNSSFRSAVKLCNNLFPDYRNSSSLKILKIQLNKEDPAVPADSVLAPVI